MDKRLTHLVTQATERLFRMAQSLAEPEDEARFCERLLQAMWRQVVVVSGPRAAKALFGQAVLEASGMWPMIKLVKVTDKGVDVSTLLQACGPTDYGLVREGCKTVLCNCLGLIATLSGGSLTLTLVDRVEAEMQGLGPGPEAHEEPETDQGNHSVA